LIGKDMLSAFKIVLRRIFALTGIVFSTRLYGHRVYFSPATDIGWRLLVRGRFERAEMELCRSFLRPDSIVVDIGANIGLHSVAFADAVPHGAVISVEPSPATYLQLLRNVAPLGNVMTINCALSSETGVTNFFVSTDSAYSGIKDTGLKSIRKQIRIPCYTGDHVISSLRVGRIDFLKIDVEGFETAVILGLEEMIREFRPVIFCEIYGGKSSNPDPTETVRLVIEKGYRAYVIRDGKLEPFKAHDDRYYNYLFVANERIETVPLLGRLEPPRMA